ncbi:MAG: NAD(P)H-quinone oxidoreductase [Eubacteriales bacterium]|nr:NAD(P)H-quinone oxidoreductase [Eubacteriales bacterium]
MRAILTDAEKRLHWSEVPDPAVGAEDVLIRVEAAAVNRADLMQREGDYPPPPGCPEWMGLEVSGTVAAMGRTAAEKSRWRPGDRVCALLGGGGYAEWVSVRYDMLMPVPAGCTMEEAAAMPEAFATSYLNLFYEGQMRPGETLLMMAGASGLASVTIPMAKAFGIRVITTVRSDARRQAIAHLGADRVVNLSEESLDGVLREELDAGHPVDAAIDCVGGAEMGACLPFLSRGGRWIMIAALGGTRTEIDLKAVYVRNLRIIGSTLRSRAPEVKARLLSDLVREVWPKVEQGLIRPTVYRVLPVTSCEEAHELLYRRENVGKVVLKVR